MNTREQRKYCEICAQHHHKGMKQRFRRRYRTAKYIFYKETLIDLREHLWTFLGSFVGIALISLLHSEYLSVHDNLFIIGSFGASSVLIYGLINSPLAQPRNLIGGHVICALVGGNPLQAHPGSALAEFRVICLAVHCRDADHQDLTSARWRNSLNCEHWF